MPLTAEQKMQRQQERTRQIADAQQRAAGYTHSPGFDPTPTARTRFSDPRPATANPIDTPAAGIATGVLSTAEQERKRREKVASGRVLTNSDL